MAFCVHKILKKTFDSFLWGILDVESRALPIQENNSLLGCTPSLCSTLQCKWNNQQLVELDYVFLCVRK